MQHHRIPRDEGFETHYLQWNPPAAGSRLPVVCVHGSLSNARMYQWIGDLLSATEKPRRVIAIDIRGCGESGMPDKGFTLQHLASDIRAVMDHLSISEAHFLAYSRGVVYALQFALDRPDGIRGLVIGDYAAHYTKLTEDWVQRVTDSYTEYDSWAGLYESLAAIEPLTREEFEARKENDYVEEEGAIRKRYRKEFPIRLQREAADHDLSAALDHIQGELLILRGSDEGSLLGDEEANIYENKGATIIQIHGAGHDVFDPRPQAEKELLNYFARVL